MTTLLSEKNSTQVLWTQLLLTKDGVAADRFDLLEGKCTIGSSPSCQIRLTSTEARPLHCLLVRDGQSVTVTRWAPGILLNGSEFTSATLLPGDQLSIGSVTLQLDSPNQTADKNATQRIEESSVALLDQMEAQVAAEVARPSAIAPLIPKPPSPYGKLDAQVAGLRTAKQQARQRLRQLIGTLRQLRARSQDLDKQVGSLSEQLNLAQRTQVSLTAELIQVQAVATERESQFSEELDRAIAELSTSYEKAASTENALKQTIVDRDRLQAELSRTTAECESLQNLQCEGAAQRHSLELELASREQQLQGLQNEYADLQHGLESSIVELHEQNQSLRNQLEEVTVEFQKQFAEHQAELQHIQAAAVEQSQLMLEAERAQFLVEVSELRTEQARFEEFHSVSVAEKHRLEQELASREGQLNQLRDELTAVRRGLEASVSELHDQNQTLREQLAKADAERERLIADREQAVATLRQQLQDAQQETVSAREVLISEREQVVSELERQLQAAQHEAEEAKAQLELPNPEILELEAELGTLRGERQKLAGENHTYTEQIAEAEKRIRLLEIDVRSANAEWQRAQSVAAQLQDEILSAEAYIADLDARLSDVACTTEVGYATERDEIFGQLTILKRILAERESSLSEVMVEREQLQTQFATAQQEMEALQEHLAEAYRGLSDLQSRAVELENERTRLTSQLAEQNSRSEQQAAELAQANAKFIEELTNRDSRIENLNRDFAKQSEDAATELGSREARVAELNSLLDQAQLRLVTETEKGERLIADSSADLAKVREQLAIEIASRESQLIELTSELSQQRDEIATKLAERESQIAHLATQFEQSHSQLTSQSSTSQSQIAELTSELTKTRDHWATECEAREKQISLLTAELTETRSALNEQIATREGQIAELKNELETIQENAAAQLSAREVELAAQLRQVQDQTASQLINPEANADALNDEWRETQAQLVVELSLREERIADLSRDLRQTQDQFADCAAQVDRLNDLYQQAQNELATLSQELSSQAVTQGEVEAEVSDEADSCDGTVSTMTVALNADPRDTFEQRAEISPELIPADDVAGEEEAPTEEFRPASFIDQYSHIFDEGESASPTEPEQIENRSCDRLESSDGGDDSAQLEAYMANMMRRVRGESSSEEIAPPLPRTTLSDGGSAQINPIERMNTLTRRVSAPEGPAPDAMQGLIDLQELKGTSQKPPLPTSLTAMRELANISARQAIAKHRKRRHFEGALSKLLVSVVAGGTAAYMLATADNYLSPYFLAGCGVATVSGFWGFKLLGIFLEMIRDGINNESTPVELNDTGEALPIDGAAE